MALCEKEIMQIRGLVNSGDNRRIKAQVIQALRPIEMHLKDYTQVITSTHFTEEEMDVVRSMIGHCLLCTNYPELDAFYTLAKRFVEWGRGEDD